MMCCTISDMMKFKQDYPETSFEVQEIGGGVLLTFAWTGARQPEEPGAAVQRSSEKSSEKILGLLRKSPPLTAREVAQQLGISWTHYRTPPARRKRAQGRAGKRTDCEDRNSIAGGLCAAGDRRKNEPWSVYYDLTHKSSLQPH
jgi:hypothetical protein